MDSLLGCLNEKENDIERLVKENQNLKEKLAKYENRATVRKYISAENLRDRHNSESKNIRKIKYSKDVKEKIMFTDMAFNSHGFVLVVCSTVGKRYLLLYGPNDELLKTTGVNSTVVSIGIANDTLYVGLKPRYENQEIIIEALDFDMNLKYRFSETCETIVLRSYPIDITTDKVFYKLKTRKNQSDYTYVVYAFDDKLNKINVTSFDDTVELWDLTVKRNILAYRIELKTSDRKDLSSSRYVTRCLDTNEVLFEFDLTHDSPFSKTAYGPNDHFIVLKKNKGQLFFSEYDAKGMLVDCKKPDTEITLGKYWQMLINDNYMLAFNFKDTNMICLSSL